MAVKDIDRGWRRIKREISSLHLAYTKVGLPEEGDIQQGNRKGSGRDETTDMSELILVGAVNEFGTTQIPERSFLRSASDEQREPINRLKEKTFMDILTQNVTPKQGLAKVGEFLTGKVKKKIRDLKIPPNAPSTISRKKSQNPLIDTGQLVQSIQHVEVFK